MGASSGARAAWWIRNLCHIETLFVLGVMILIVYYAFFSKKKLSYEAIGPLLTPQLFKEPKLPKKLAKKKYKHEERCREIFETIFGRKFGSVRPDWLKNPVTDRNLELDGYCPSIKTPLGVGLAFEYDGGQHSKYTPQMQKGGPMEFVYQTKKDSWKDLRCKQEGVLLIRIPHFVAFPDLERYIKNKLRQEGLGSYVDKNSIYE